MRKKAVGRRRISSLIVCRRALGWGKLSTGVLATMFLGAKLMGGSDPIPALETLADNMVAYVRHPKSKDVSRNVHQMCAHFGQRGDITQWPTESLVELEAAIQETKALLFEIEHTLKMERSQDASDAELFGDSIRGILDVLTQDIQVTFYRNTIVSQ